MESTVPTPSGDLAQNPRQIRFITAVEGLHLEFPVAEIARKTGYSEPTVSQYLNSKTKVSSKFIKTFAEAFELDENEILATEIVKPHHQKRFEQKLKGQKRLTPFFDAEADASDKDTDMMPVTEAEGYIDTGDLFGRCEAAIRIRGNSMLSGYPSGTVLGLNRDLDNFIEPGELYVLETRSKRVFKRIYEDEKDPNILLCYSDNQMTFTEGQRKGMPMYPSFRVHRSDVMRVWQVVGSSREHGNSFLLYSRPYKEENRPQDIHIIESTTQQKAA